MSSSLGQIVKDEVNEKCEVMCSAARVFEPLLDALKWQGDKSRKTEALVRDVREMDTDSLLESLANLNYQFHIIHDTKISELDNRLLPILLVQDNNHLVLLSIENDGCLLFDGREGIYKQYDKQAIKGEMYHFTYATSVADSLIQPQKNWFNKLIYRFKKYFIHIAIITLFITILDLMLPLFIIMMFDQILNLKKAETLIIIVIGISIYIISSYSLNQIRSKIINFISVRVGNIISTQIFSRLMYLSPSYTETVSRNAQISRINDFDSIKKFIISSNFTALFSIPFVFIYIIAMVILAGWIGLVPLATLLILLVVGLIMRPFHKLKAEKMSDSAASKQQKVIEIFKYSDEIKVSGTKDNWINKFKELMANNIMDNIDLTKHVNSSNNISYFITNASVLIIIFGGVIQVMNDNMSTGALIGLLLLSWKVMLPLRGAFNLVVQAGGLMKSIDQIDRFMMLPQDNNLTTNVVESKGIQGRIMFSDVSIRYTQAASPVLLGINFAVDPGEALGITGHNGAGKTTILKLIMAMYQPQAGRIIIDAMNIKQLEPLSLRRSISYAPERDTILAGTIRDNFKSYNMELTDENIVSICEETGLWDYLQQNKYDLDTYLSEEKIYQLSPTIKKLLNISRMVGRNVPIYLIDEPENNLNYEALEKVIKVIKRLVEIEGATVIISSKDQRILDICTKTIEVNQGRIVKGYQ